MSSRHAFVVDVNKCTGCDACTIACQVANNRPATLQWRQVRTFNELHVPGVELIHLSMACNHCLDAPCMQQCPALAYRRDEITGAVLIDDQACLGCGYCAWVCPYGAPQMDQERGVMTKCTMCNEKVLAGGQPACVTSCPTGALDWRQLAPAELTQDVPGFAEADTAPGIRVEGVKPERRVPHQTTPPAMPPWEKLRARFKPQITLLHEWPLAVFTLLAAVLVGGFAGSRLGGAVCDWRLWLGAGVVGMALSASHLGRLERSWRAPLHTRASWLSREIVLYATFLGLSSAVLAQPGWLPWMSAWSGLAVACGVGLLLVIDRVYAPVRKAGGGLLHSAEVAGTGLLVAAVLARMDLLIVTVAALKTVLFVTRSSARDAIGLALPRMGLMVAGVGDVLVLGGQPVSALVLILGGELIDRGLYYHELEIPTPELLMLTELAGRPAAVGADTPNPDL